MEEVKIILTLQSYLEVKNRTRREPLLLPSFLISYNIRKEIHEELFGNPAGGNTSKVNSKFYKWVWENKQHYCEECGHRLAEYSPAFISHIMSRGAHPEFAHDPRNTNILCLRDHEKWENGKRELMSINTKNQKVIDKLQTERNYPADYL